MENERRRMLAVFAQMRKTLKIDLINIPNIV